MEALRREVQQLKAERAGALPQVTALTERAATAEASAAAAEVMALLEFERAVEVTHPEKPPFVRTHSKLYRILCDGGGRASEQRWAHCFHGCPVPRGRCLDMLTLLAQLQQAPGPPAYRIFHILSKPLFDCLEHVADADLADMQQAAEYLQLPKPLVTRVAQHAEARALRLGNTSPAALPAALQRGALLSLVGACVAAVPRLHFDDTDYGLQLPWDIPVDRENYLPAVESSLAQQRELLASPYFFHGPLRRAVGGAAGLRRARQPSCPPDRPVVGWPPAVSQPACLEPYSGCCGCCKQRRCSEAPVGK
jgi:hypothetical protein